MKAFTTNTLLLAAATLVVAGGLYWYFFTGADAPVGARVAGSPSTEAQAKFETLIGQLGPITFDLAILSDPRFLSLVDLSTPIEEEPIGRKDPFAPLSGQ
jgi:hypothetical protein